MASEWTARPGLVTNTVRCDTLKGELLGLLSQGGGDGDADAMRTGLESLLVRLRRHFMKEQGAMALALYPDYVEHRAEHDRFLAEFWAMVMARPGGVKCLAGAACFALKHIDAHRRDADARLGDFLSLNPHYLRPSYIPIRTPQYTAVQRI